MKLGIIVCVTVSMSVLTQASLSQETMERYFGIIKVNPLSNQQYKNKNIEKIIGEDTAKIYFGLTNEYKQIVQFVTQKIYDESSLDKEIKDEGGDKSYLLLDLINLLNDISVQKNNVLETYNDLKTNLNDLNIQPLDDREPTVKDIILKKIESLKPDIDNVMNLHKLLDKKINGEILTNKQKQERFSIEIDKQNKKIEAIMKEISQQETQISQQETQISQQETQISQQETQISQQNNKIIQDKKEFEIRLKEKREELRQLKKYEATLKKFRGIVGISE